MSSRNDHKHDHKFTSHHWLSTISIGVTHRHTIKNDRGDLSTHITRLAYSHAFARIQIGQT